VSHHLCSSVPLIWFTLSAYSKGLYTDLSLKSSDNRLFKTHKLIIVAQSSMLTKILQKTPKKHEISIPASGSILKQTIRYCYTGQYSVDSTFKSEWALTDTDKAALALEFHFKMVRCAADMGIPKLEALASHKLHSALNESSASHPDSLYKKLLEVPKKGMDPPYGVVEAIIEAQARKVKKAVAQGAGMNGAFQDNAAPVEGSYLQEYIQAVSNVLGVRLRLYLRCPECGAHVRAKQEGKKKFVCVKEGCKEAKKLPELVPDDRRVLEPMVLG